jgi:anti-sigma factor RsiW
MNMNCREMKTHLEEAAFASRPLTGQARKHLADCTACAAELAELQATWKLLDEWQAPEPSAFFDAKLYARLRTEQTKAPASLFERAKAWWLYTSNLQTRQLAAGALATVMFAVGIGGGTFALLDHQQAPVAPTSATVRDLESYDQNAQLFQQLSSMGGDEDSAAGASN